MESFLQKGDYWDVILTVQNEKARAKVQKMIELNEQRRVHHQTNNKNGNVNRDAILGEFICDVTDPTSTEFFFVFVLVEIDWNLCLVSSQRSL